MSDKYGDAREELGRMLERKEILQEVIQHIDTCRFLRDQANGLTFNNNFWPLSNWTHIAVVCKAGTVKMYINGSTAVTGAGFASGGWGSPGSIGRIGFGEATMFGDIDQIRISKVARYDGNFSVPTAPFILD